MQNRVTFQVLDQILERHLCIRMFCSSQGLRVAHIEKKSGRLAGCAEGRHVRSALLSAGQDYHGNTVPAVCPQENEREYEDAIDQWVGLGNQIYVEKVKSGVVMQARMPRDERVLLQVEHATFRTAYAQLNRELAV